MTDRIHDGDAACRRRVRSRDGARHKSRRATAAVGRDDKIDRQRLAHALDDLAGHMDVDQLRWRVLPRITGRELPPSWNGASRGSEDGRD